MTELTCPLCDLTVPVAASRAAPEMEHCPRCLAHTDGALAVKLERTRADASRLMQRRVAKLLRQLRPAATRR
jgi:Zn-finger nucleic acid-binding protein